MSMISNIGPAEGETQDDFLINTIYRYAKGTEQEKKESRFVLTLTAVGEFAHEGNDAEVRYDKNGSRLITAVYNHRSSVEKDLELTNYGVSPFVAHSFPVLDSIAVFGKFGRANTGFVLDYFCRDIHPPVALSISGSRAKSSLEDAARNVFDFEIPGKKSSYIEKGSRKGLFDLSPYDGRKNTRSLICEGEILLNGPKVTQNELALAMIENIAKYHEFDPRKWVLKHYDFKIDFGPDNGEEIFQKKYVQLVGRIKRVLGEKAARREAA